jgi:alkylation response protein AidB-like acyl-CoA dehydrogenase
VRPFVRKAKFLTGLALGVPIRAMSPAKREQLLRDVDAFCAELRPSEEVCYVEHKLNDQLIPLAKKYNLLGMPVPEEYGGRGADAVAYAEALMRIGREGTGVRTFFSGHTSIGQFPICFWGSDEQKRKYLPPSTRGESIMAFGLTEPDAGSNPRELQTNYERRGDHFVLNGMKYLISNGSIATVAINFAYPKGKQEGMSAFIVDMGGGGLNREMLTAKLGLRTSDTSMYEFTDYRVPAENMLGREGDGMKIAMHTLMSGRLSVAAGQVGVIEDCLAEAIEYARSRVQHGKPIGKHQLVQDHIALIQVALETSRCFVMEAARAKQAHHENSENKDLLHRADLLIAQAKYYASRSAWEAADHAVQVFGGRGYSELYRPGRHLQDSRVCRIYEGTEEILKLKIAASLLGKDFEAYR